MYPTRTLHLIDLENLARTASISDDLARILACWYLTTANYRAGDLIVVATSHHSGVPARLAFPGATVRWRSGIDGADHALIDAAAEFDLTRFSRLVIGSGDGIFTDLCHQARHAGVEVHVVAHPGGTATTLRQAATDVVSFALAA